MTIERKLGAIKTCCKIDSISFDALWWCICLSIENYKPFGVEDEVWNFKLVLLCLLAKTSDTRRLNLKSFAVQIQIQIPLPKKHWGVGHKGWVFCRNNDWIMENTMYNVILPYCDFEKSAILKNQPFWIFLFKFLFFFCFILMKISPNLYGIMDGLKFWRFPWFSGKFLLCVI